MDDMKINRKELIKHHLPKNKKTRKIIFKESNQSRLKNKENYKGPDFYLLNRVFYFCL